MNNERRLEWLDVARGIAIILVVLGHAIPVAIRQDNSNLELVYDVIYKFHMPLWFFLSGYAYGLGRQKNQSKLFLRKKACTLLKPYISYNITIYVIFLLLSLIKPIKIVMTKSGFEVASFDKWLLQLLNGRVDINAHTWYLYTLFILSIILWIVDKKVKSQRRNNNNIIIIGIISLVISYIYDFTSIWIVYTTLRYMFWFFIGSIVKLDAIRNKCVYMGCSFIIVIYVYCFIINEIISMEHKWLLLILKIMFIFSITILVYGICNIIRGVTKKILCMCGKYSFGIYLFHQPFFASVIGTILKKTYFVNDYFIVGITFLTALGCSMFIDYWLRRKKNFIYKLYYGK